MTVATGEQVASTAVADILQKLRAAVAEQHDVDPEGVSVGICASGIPVTDAIDEVEETDAPSLWDAHIAISDRITSQSHEVNRLQTILSMCVEHRLLASPDDADWQRHLRAESAAERAHYRAMGVGTGLQIAHRAVLDLMPELHP